MPFKMWLGTAVEVFEDLAQLHAAHILHLVLKPASMLAG